MSEFDQLSPERQQAIREDTRRHHSSVHNETAAALEDTELEARAAAFTEAVEFLRGSGFDDAANALDMAVFGRAGS